MRIAEIILHEYSIASRGNLESEGVAVAHAEAAAEAVAWVGIIDRRGRLFKGVLLNDDWT
jgi:hypothetical protein